MEGSSSVGKRAGGRRPGCLVLHDDKSRLWAQDLQPVYEMHRTTGRASGCVLTNVHKISCLETEVGLPPGKIVLLLHVCTKSTSEGQGTIMPQ